jgi:DNA-binding MarR family transcriptional regulator
MGEPQPDPYGPDPYNLVDLLRRYSVETDRYIDRFAARHELHRTDLHALAVMMQASESGRPLTPGALGAALNLSSPATTALLDRLAGNGHVLRERSAADRRRVELTISARAETVGAELFGPLSREVGRAVAHYSAKEQELIARFLTDMVAATVTAREAGSSG